MRNLRAIPGMLLLAGCTLVSGGEEGIRVVPELSVYVPDEIAVVEIRNHSDRTIYLNRCTSVYPLYRVRKVQEDGSIAVGYAPTCSGTRPSTRILPGTAVATQIRIRVVAGRGEPIAGNYHIEMGLYHDEAAVSAPVPEGAARSRVIRIEETRTP